MICFDNAAVLIQMQINNDIHPFTHIFACFFDSALIYTTSIQKYPAKEEYISKLVPSTNAS